MFKTSLLIVALGCWAPLLSACGDDAADPTGTGGGGTTGTGTGTPCGADTCTDQEYCGFAPGTCDGDKSCYPLPTECQALACGCDGFNYGTDCLALTKAGGTTSVAAACEPAAGEFTCIYEYQVPIYCSLDTEYCHVQATDSGPYQLTCMPLPTGCTPQPGNCDCLMDACSADYCGVDAETTATTVLCTL